MLRAFMIMLMCLSALNALDSSDSKYSAESIANLFYTLNFDSQNPHKKINHTKGFCAAGIFKPNAKVARELNVPLLEQERINALVRYSLGGGSEGASDKSKSRGMAIKLSHLSDLWEIVALNSEINFAKNAKEFYEFFAMRVPQNGKVDVQNIKAKMQKVPSYRNYEAYMQHIGITPSVARTSYHSVHTFFMKDKSGKDLPIKFKFEPLESVAYLSEAELSKMGDNFLSKDFRERVKSASIDYKLVAILANNGDVIDDTTARWSGAHRELELGVLSVSEYKGEACNSDVFMPNVLPQGISAPIDKIFNLRNEVYAITFSRRQ